ncbi:MAG TPA: VCBS domain-containing protein, partial [Pseudohongiella sp.]|nr:VCBS domain-containing protein [Pseudohongiella sp.]
DSGNNPGGNNGGNTGGNNGGGDNGGNTGGNNGGNTGGNNGGNTGGSGNTAPVTAVNDNAIALVKTEPKVVQSTTTHSFGNFGLLPSTKEYSFSLDQDSVTNMTLNLRSSGLLTLLGGFTFELHQVAANGSTTPVGSGGSGALLNVLGLLGDSLQVNISNLSGGNYVLRVKSPGLSLLSGVTANISKETTYTKEVTVTPMAPVTGNVVSGPGKDSLGPDDAATVYVMQGGSLVAAGGGTVVNGTYGKLTIDAQGNYSYAPNADAGVIGKSDSFAYTLVHPNGDTSSATLTISIQNPNVQALSGPTMQQLALKAEFDLDALADQHGSGQTENADDAFDGLLAAELQLDLPEATEQPDVELAQVPEQSFISYDPLAPVTVDDELSKSIAQSSAPLV